MTGFFTEERYQQITQAGAETCLSKPIAIQTLLDAIGIDFNAEKMSK
ncbi:MAG: hypothetical protein GQ581_08970, partial [Methyloprofundus sp.]|nr:hypothetical protein [Methyloprofundus sp.]